MSGYPPPYPPPYGQPPYGPPPPMPYAPYGAYGSYAPAWAGPAVRTGRPGLVSAIGVISIVVASLSMLGSLGTGMYGLTMLKMKQMSVAMTGGGTTGGTGGIGGSVTGVTSLRPAQTRPAAPPRPVQGPEGMGLADRAAVVNAFGQIEVLTPDRVRQLDAILLEAGHKVLPFRQATPTAADIFASLKDHGTLPSADPADADPVYFDTPTGRLELHNDRALFRPADQSDLIRATAPPPGTTPDEAEEPPPTPATPPPAVARPPRPPAVTPGGAVDPFASDDDPTPPGGTTQPTAAAPVAPVTGNALTPAQIQSVIQKTQVVCKNKLNPAQVAALQAELASPTQELVPPGLVWSPVQDAYFQPDGTATIRMGKGFVTLDPNGTIIDQASNRMPVIAIQPLSIATVLGESAASFALAVFLMVAGILTLRQSRRGGWLHLIYAIGKIPLAVLGGIGMAWVTTGFVNSVAVRGGGAGGGMATFGVVMAVAGLVYPVVLLFVLFSKSVRDYFRGGAAAAG